MVWYGMVVTRIPPLMTHPTHFPGGIIKGLPWPCQTLWLGPCQPASLPDSLALTTILPDWHPLADGGLVRNFHFSLKTKPSQMKTPPPSRPCQLVNPEQSASTSFSFRSGGLLWVAWAPFAFGQITSGEPQVFVLCCHSPAPNTRVAVSLANIGSG